MALRFKPMREILNSDAETAGFEVEAEEGEGNARGRDL